MAEDQGDDSILDEIELKEILKIVKSTRLEEFPRYNETLQSSIVLFYENGVQIGQSHPTGLSANLLKLLEPRPPLEFKPPPEKRKGPPDIGMAQFVSNFAEPGDAEYAPPVQKAKTPVKRRARIHKTRLEEGAKKAAEELEKYDPNNDPNIFGDPYKTLFVARLNYEKTKRKIKRKGKEKAKKEGVYCFSFR